MVLASLWWCVLCVHFMYVYAVWRQGMLFYFEPLHGQERAKFKRRAVTAVHTKLNILIWSPRTPYKHALLFLQHISAKIKITLSRNLVQLYKTRLKKCQLLLGFKFILEENVHCSVKSNKLCMYVTSACNFCAKYEFWNIATGML